MSCQGSFQKHLEVTVPPDFGGMNGVCQVPKKRCVIIEYISGEAFMPKGQKALLGIITTAHGVQVRHYLGTHSVGAVGGEGYFWISGPAAIYADPGTNVTLRQTATSLRVQQPSGSAFPVT